MTFTGRPALRSATLAIATSLCLAAPSAFGGPKRITAKLEGKPNFTIIALAANGEARSIRVGEGRIRLKPPARVVTLHLRGRDGAYAGPVVIDRANQGKRAILGVEEGASLGSIEVHGRFAKLARDLAGDEIAGNRISRARRGIPIGAGSVGHVRSKRRKGDSVPGDPDFDGVPDPLDIDDDGDLVLDAVDPVSRPVPAQALDTFSLHPVLPLTGSLLVNASAITIDRALVSNRLKSEGRVSIGGAGPGQGLEPGAEIDCGGSIQDPPRPIGLGYCSLGGTGKIWQGDGMPETWPRFPDDFDSDADGMGAPTDPMGGPTESLTLAHGAGLGEIGSGDIIIQRFNDGSGPAERPATLGFVFATVPALRSYSDGAGHTASPAYPVDPGDPGSAENGFPVAVSGGGDRVLTMEFWPPQRPPGPLEHCPEPDGPLCGPDDWIDMGHLTHKPILGPRFDATPGTPDDELNGQGCPPETITIPAGQELDPVPTAGGGFGGVIDRRDDAPTDPLRTFTYTLNLTDCLASLGIPVAPGESLGMGFDAQTQGSFGLATSGMVFKFE